MARRSLKPQLNQIRAWVRQGRTDAWIAHQLEVSASELREFRKQHELTPDEEASQEVDLRDEIEAEIEAAAAEEDEEEAASEEAAEGEEGAEAEKGEEAEEAEAGGAEAEAGGAEAEAKPRRRRRRGRRGGRGRRREYEASFDHGETEGYGLWLDPSVAENPVYLEHWAGKREVSVRIDPEQIVIRRAGSEEPDESDE
jgi:hypothetical protein